MIKMVALSVVNWKEKFRYEFRFGVGKVPFQNKNNSSLFSFTQFFNRIDRVKI
jgi:hypothetical protein